MGQGLSLSKVLSLYAGRCDLLGDLPLWGARFSVCSMCPLPYKRITSSTCPAMPFLVSVFVR
jgi:hypothetical protein